MDTLTHPRASDISKDPRWAAVRTRDKAADGLFVYSVRSTGVYCRPSCPSRLARPENVWFHRNCAEAEAAGFRACKRCKPEESTTGSKYAATIEAACRILEASDAAPSLDELAKSAALSTSHFHRLFKQSTGLTPAQYARAKRQERVRDLLRQSGSVTEAIFDAGYNSNGRFYESADAMLGMKAQAYRKGGANTQIRFAVGQCSLGAILVAQSERGICAISLGDDPEALLHNLQDDFPRAMLVGNDREFEKLVAQVVGFVEAPHIGLDLPLDIRGTAFQQRVWNALRELPAGERLSYSELARRIGMPKAVRAVASACAANRIAVAIPCHRVVRTNGDLSGYRWGIERKRSLLDKEKTL